MTWVRGRSRRERIGLAAAPVVLVVAVVGVLLAGGGGDAGRWLAGSPTDTQSDEAVETGGGENPDTAPESEPRTGPTGVVPPYVHSFAEQPGTKPRAPEASPTAGVDVAEGTDGCDHAYGDRNVCVPWEFPAGVGDRCGWLRERGFEPLKITGGRDRHGLDRNGDGTACGSGD
ncbi:hypothetical protein O7635_23765 [Asanoa sp. WMMD1127]|uniref:hypothetical protein n=1 Tax=Asanoa sp. WMMD1127 TaxID=3016107 RepID=UPI002417883C|nr:hypothetical protein [Asanoa sp. WMMD1127]MDG4824878.1 hypothetical protein [Asanoa sp. WMMD1127]